MKLWLFFMGLFLLFRIIFVFLFKDQLGADSTAIDVIAAILNGMRFDSVISSCIVLLPFFFSICCIFADLEAIAIRARNLTGTLFVGLSTIICLVTLTYFKEFNDQFNQFLFNLIYDDRKAILLTVLKEYHLIPNIIVMAVLIYLLVKLMRRIIREPFLSKDVLEKYIHTPLHRAVVFFLILCLFVIGIRGSAGRIPVRERSAAITKDEFLNKTVLNPFSALRYAILEQINLSKSQGIEVYLPDGDVVNAAQHVFGTDQKYGDIDSYMTRYAKGPKHVPPRHIFFIVAESYSQWPMWDKYKSLGLAEGVKSLAENGVFVKNFVASSAGTMTSLSAIISGLPDAGVITNYRPTAAKPYPSSLPYIFKQLGYKTRFFYGGYLSWQKVGDFCKAQGFEEIYGGGDMGGWLAANEWGLADEYLFDFVLSTVKDDQPSFNMILTTTFHPPYTVDVREKGFTLNAIPDDLKKSCLEDVDFLALGHFWYMDRCIGDFGKAIEHKVKLPLVVITADTPVRRKINKTPDLYEKTAIPFVLYGKDVLKGISLPSGAAGSHIDITPTLVELTAPKGFSYHTMGKDLLDPEQRPFGIGLDLVIGSHYIVEMGEKSRIHPLSEKTLPQNVPDLSTLKKLYDSMYGIAWWRIMKGPNVYLPK